MEDEVRLPFLITSHLLDHTATSNVSLRAGNLSSEIPNISILEDESGTSEANDVLKNGILIETSKG